ncbi:unnamed protein product [Colias eurytheme]|nr:unnamed protein product [Colias eurytheme]
MYITKSGLKRLHKGAVPQNALFLSSTSPDIISNINDKLTEKQNKSAPTVNFNNNVVTAEPSTSFLVVNGTDNTFNENLPLDDFPELDSIFETPRKIKLKKELHRKTMLQIKHFRIIKTLREKNRRLKKTNCNLKSIIKSLKKERFIDNDIYNLLSKNVVAADIFNNIYIKNKKNKKILPKYTNELKKFCLTLNFHSPSAYNYVRSKFSTCLPHPKTLGKWYRNVDGSPGFTDEAFTVLKLKADNGNIICALIADEMSIRQQSLWDRNQNHGYVDMGIGVNDTSVLASEAYVFLLVCLTEHWKLPVGYFLVHGLTGSQKANLISLCLSKCHEVGVRVLSITFDGHPSNISAMEILGCRIKDPKNLMTTFKHPSSNEDVAVFLDPVHMFKLIRNHFESKKIFLDEEENEIDWSYLEYLHELQDKEGVHLANKITKRHLEFRNNIMKVKLAAQLLSRSVAIALKFCREDLYLPEFKNSEATEKFIVLWNNLFDIFNTRDLKQHGFSHPIYNGNKDNILNYLEQAKQYILNLHVKTSRKRSFKEHNQQRKIIFKSFKPVLSTQGNTGFLGILVCIESLKHITKFLDEGLLKFISSYKFTQDHIELLFSAIRMHGGFNDNPNTKQFKGIYRKLLCHLELKTSDTGNCIQLQNIAVLNCSSALKCINRTTMCERFEEEDPELLAAIEMVKDEFDQITEFVDVPYMSNFKNQVVGYIAGFVVKSLSKQIKCINCIDNLTAKNRYWFHKFVTLKDRGGLSYASEDVYLICMVAESIIQNIDKVSDIQSNIIYKKIVIDVMKKFVGSDSRRYFEFDMSHVSGAIHQTNLMRLVVEKYIQIRLHFISKRENLQKSVNSKRQIYRKLVQVSGM